MAVISGYVTNKELKEIKERPDATILKLTKTEHCLGNNHIELDVDWGVMELLENFED